MGLDLDIEKKCVDEKQKKRVEFFFNLRLLHEWIHSFFTSIFKRTKKVYSNQSALFGRLRRKGNIERIRRLDDCEEDRL
jgi:hypothetical protein